MTLTQTEMAHAIDDAEKARTKVVRAAQDASALLRDAQSALAAGDLGVVEEFIDRARVHLVDALPPR